MSKDKIQLTEDEQNKLNKELMDSDHTPWVVSAIIKGADINTKGRGDVTALHLAAQGNDLDNIIFFLEKGADINAKDYRGQTPFMLAMESKHAEAMKLLISKGYDATKEEKSKIFEIEHPTLNDKLFTALEKCDINETDALIKQGADVNAKQNGEPLLSYAFHSMLPFAEHGLDAIKLLIEKGADVKAKDSYKDTPLTPLMTRHTDFSKFTQFGLDCFNLLLKKGADINSQNIYGRTILHNFVTKCDLAGDINILLKNGADVNSQDGNGKTPLNYAVEKLEHVVSNCETTISEDHKQFIAQLLMSGAKVQTEKLIPLGFSPNDFDDSGRFVWSHMPISHLAANM